MCWCALTRTRVWLGLLARSRRLQSCISIQWNSEFPFVSGVRGGGSPFLLRHSLQELCRPLRVLAVCDNGGACD